MLKCSGSYWWISYEKLTRRKFNKIKKLLVKEEKSNKDEKFLFDNYFILPEYIHWFFAPHSLKIKKNNKPIKFEIKHDVDFFPFDNKKNCYILSLNFFKNGNAILEGIEDINELEIKQRNFYYDAGFVELIEFYKDGEALDVMPEDGRNTYTEYFLMETIDGEVVIF